MEPQVGDVWHYFSISDENVELKAHFVIVKVLPLHVSLYCLEDCAEYAAYPKNMLSSESWSFIQRVI